MAYWLAWLGGAVRSRLSEGKGPQLERGVLVIIGKWSSSGKARKKWCRVDRSLGVRVAVLQLGSCIRELDALLYMLVLN